MTALMKFFSIEQFDGGAFVTPLETVHSFTDVEVRSEWEQVLQNTDEANAHKIAVDLGKLSFFGSAMLEWIVLLGRHVKDQGGKLVLCCPEAPTLEVLKIVTPCVLRPAMRMSLTGHLISCPPSVTSMMW